MPIKPPPPPLWQNTLDLTASTIPPGSTLSLPPGAGGGSGTVTAVTGTAPIASSGGTAPDISLDASGVSAASYGDATHVGTFTVDTHGLITAAANVAITGTAPGGAAGGDLSGTYPNPTVAKINTVALGTTTATAGNLLIGSGTAWVTNAMSGDVTINSTGVTAIGANKVTNSMLATMAAGTIKMNNTAGTATPTDVLPDTALIQRFYYASSTSGTGTYTATLAPVPTAYTDGAQYTFTATSTNTTASPTINFNSLGALNILFNGVAAAPNQIIGGYTYQGIRVGSNLLITGPGAPLLIASYPDLRYGTSDNDDFMNDSWTLAANLSRPGYKTTFITSQTNSAVVMRSAGGGSGMQGVAKVSTGTTNSGSVIAFGGGQNGTGGNGSLQLGDGTLEVIWFFETTTLSTSGERYGSWFGIADNITSSPANFIAVLFQDNVNSGAFQLRVTVGSAAQANTNGVTTVVANTKYHLRLVIAPGSVKFYSAVYGGAETLEGTYTGSQPASSAPMGTWAFMGKSVGTTNRDQYWDGWQYNYTFTNQR